MKSTLLICLILLAIGLLFVCNSKPKNGINEKVFQEILNDPQMNSKEVGEREGIKHFQVMKDGKTGFRDLNGKIVIEPIFDAAEMFSEGYSAVKVGKQFGLIDEKRQYVLKPQYDYLGSVHNGLASFRENDKYGFINTAGQVKIKPQFDWSGEFSEGLCVVRDDHGKLGSGKNGYIDTTGKVVIEFLYSYGSSFKDGKAKVGIDSKLAFIDKTGKIVTGENDIR